MRRDAAKAQDYARRHNIETAYSDADDLINDPNVDAVYIATPPNTHPELTIRALNAGKPVLVEKPIALSVTDADEMIACAEENRVPLIVAYYRRALPRFERLREIVQSGQIGEPRCVQVQHFKRRQDRPEQSWKLDPKVGGGGHFTDMQTHVLDWLDYVFGPATSVAGHVRWQSDDDDAEDLVSYSIAFGKVIASATCAYSTNQTTESVAIHGSEASARMSFFSSSPIILSANGVRTVHDLRDPVHVHQPFITRTVAYLLGKAENPSPADSARRTTAVLQELYEAS